MNELATASSVSVIDTVIAARGDAGACQKQLDIATLRADACEPWLHAFTYRPTQQTVADAVVDSPLAGLPIGVKDLVATSDMPTTYGSPIYSGHQPANDAWISAQIRRMGGTIFGKTVSTEFAWREPGPTVNPWNPLHTPGGSSSGSAAAVGAGIVPLAIGTQTVGSIIRPAAYCGVIGFKPSHGRIPTEGVHPLAPSLDHLGFFAKQVDLVALAYALIVENKPEVIDDVASWNAYFNPRKPTRLAVVRTPFWDRASDDQKANFDQVLSALGQHGVELVEREPYPAMPAMIDALMTILRVEAHEGIEPLVAQYPDQVSKHIRTLTAAGAETSRDSYLSALALQRRLREQSAELLGDCDAIVTLPATGEAPLGLLDTGDATFCAPWSFIGTPAITLPSGRAKTGLPLGFQLVGAFNDDVQVLRMAAWVEGRLGHFK
ncbi:Asp-tRNAAsn/Glu-tRNAGln amidotransferase A subunit [Pararobbsia alpina]|uniref:amidase n=1 Tax=Pararobbsia alpina TaxID=621374 RepID=UPI0039A53AF2